MGWVSQTPFNVVVKSSSLKNLIFKEASTMCKFVTPNLDNLVIDAKLMPSYLTGAPDLTSLTIRDEDMNKLMTGRFVEQLIQKNVIIKSLTARSNCSV